MLKKTKIMATYGPAIAEVAKVRKLAAAGVNVFRVNCSHGGAKDFERAVRTIRQGTQNCPYPVAIMFDIAGLKLRLDRFQGEVPIHRGEVITLTSERSDLKHGRLGVNYSGLIRSVKKGERLFIDDGQLLFEIVSANGKTIKAKAMNAGKLLSAKGINLPDSQIDIDSITKKDKEDIRTAVKLNADLIALSFVRSALDIGQARRIISRAGGQQRVIAKLEKREAIENLDDIIVASDGVMIARGDLGVELPPAELPRIQKKIVAISNKYHKPVIVATQMLESMRSQPRATRAELNDVASAVFDYVDCVMLAAETASGLYPEEAVRAMSAVIEATESALPPHQVDVTQHIYRSAHACAIAESVSHTYNCCPTNVILSFTTSGYTAEIISNLFPPQIIIALSPHSQVLRQLCLYRSVYGVVIKQPRSFEEMIAVVDKVSREHRLVKRGETVVITGGTPFGSTVPTNFLKYHEVR